MPEEDCINEDPEELIFPDKDALGSPTTTGVSVGTGSTGAPTAGGNPSGGTPIYRYGYTGADKLVPTNTDVDTNTGLSFSTKPKPGSAMTTIEAVNSTGKLMAVRDGGRHVSVYPVNGSIAEWHHAGTNSIWTQALIGIVIMS